MTRVMVRSYGFKGKPSVEKFHTLKGVEITPGGDEPKNAINGRFLTIFTYERVLSSTSTPFNMWK